MIKLVLLFKLSTFEFLVEYFISIIFLRQIPINSLKYAAISRKVVGKNVHATIPKGNIGYVPNTVAVSAFL